MEASEKLMQSLNETWEEKLQRTQAVQKEREKALEELGITVEKNLVGVHTPKKASIISISWPVPRPLPGPWSLSPSFIHLFMRLICDWLTDVIFRCPILSIWCVSFHVRPSSDVFGCEESKLTIPSYLPSSLGVLYRTKVWAKSQIFDKHAYNPFCKKTLL
jgi:hypothetical protein